MTSYPPLRNRGTALLQRKWVYGSLGPTTECEDPNEKWLQQGIRNPQSEIRDDSFVPPIVDEVLNSCGQPLDPKTRAFMESGFRHDFGNVRVHTDSKAAESARAVNALAYTAGQQ